MANYNLTEEQRDLLRTIVASLEAGELEEPIIRLSHFGGSFIIGEPDQNIGPFGSNLRGNLGALCEEDLLRFDYNRSGDKIYSVKQAGYDAVANDFVREEAGTTARLSIGNVIGEVTGGTVQGIGLASADVQQIVNDPQLLEKTLDGLAERLIDCVRSEVSAESHCAFKQAVDDLREQLESEAPSEVRTQNSLRVLITLLGDVEGTISFFGRVLPLITFLVQIGALRTGAL